MLNPDILLAALSVILIATAIFAVGFAYRHVCALTDNLSKLPLANQAVRTDNPPVEERSIQSNGPAASLAEWTETEAVILNSLQGRITVNIIAQPNRETIPPTQNK